MKCTYNKHQFEITVSFDTQDIGLHIEIDRKDGAHTALTTSRFSTHIYGSDVGDRVSIIFTSAAFIFSNSIREFGGGGDYSIKIFLIVV